MPHHPKTIIFDRNLRCVIVCGVPFSQWRLPDSWLMPRWTIFLSSGGTSASVLSYHATSIKIPAFLPHCAACHFSQWRLPDWCQDERLDSIVWWNVRFSLVLPCDRSPPKSSIFKSFFLLGHMILPHCAAFYFSMKTSWLMPGWTVWVCRLVGTSALVGWCPRGNRAPTITRGRAKLGFSSLS